DLTWRAGPKHTSFWVFTFLFIAIPTASIFLLPHGKVVGPTYLLTLLGISFYLYLPFASEGNPPMNWAYPRTWEGFLHSITRGQYEKVKLSDIFGNPERFIGQLGAYFRDLKDQFSLWVAGVGMLPFTIWSIKVGGKRFNVFYLGLAMLLGIGIFGAVAQSVLPPGLEGMTMANKPFLAKIYKLFAMGLAVLAGMGIISFLIKYFRTEINKWGLSAGLAIMFLALILGGLAYLDLSLLKQIFSPKTQFTNQMLYLGMVLGPPLAVGLVWWFMTGPLEMRNEMTDQSQRWALITLAAFIATSVILIIFLNHKLDIQTLFIGRVQLIQSHAVYAIWLGYGLIILLARLVTLAQNHVLVRVIAIIVALFLPVHSLWLNAYDQTRLDVVGGAE
ncbi:MAG: hypothetical protein AAF492_28920, partial [Verrucomicrobiota bacterium]